MIKKLKHNVWQLHFSEFGSCVYLLKLPEPILIDTSAKEVEDELLEDLNSLKIEPEYIKSIILTHNHWDHIGNLDLFKNAKIYDARNIKELKKDFPELKPILAPGHTREDLCILYENVLFSGDVIFDKTHDYIGRTDLPESIPEKMQESLEKLKKIDYEILAPGHLV